MPGINNRRPTRAPRFRILPTCKSSQANPVLLNYLTAVSAGPVYPVGGAMGFSVSRLALVSRGFTVFPPNARAHRGPGLIEDSIGNSQHFPLAERWFFTRPAGNDH